MSILGFTYKDKITGFSGVCTGYVEYISGCNQLLLVPPAKPDGELGQSHWFDVQRCELVPDAARVSLDNGATPGCDAPAPKR